jgi:hypothetical protein
VARAGASVIFNLYLEQRGRIFLLLLFSKNEQANLSPKQVKQVAAMVERIKESNREEAL